MSGRKGRVPQSFKDGKIDKYNFKNLSKEQMQKVVQKSVESRKKKKQEKMFLQKCMREILTLNVASNKQKEILRSMGIEDEELTNKTLLMMALFKKGVTGDVGAIKEIVDMIDKLDLFEDSGKLTQNNVTINLIPTGEVYEPSEEDAQDIWKAENGILDDEEDDSEWGTDVYNG